MWKVTLCTKKFQEIATLSSSVHTAISFASIPKFVSYVLVEKELIPLSLWKKKHTKALFYRATSHIHTIISRSACVPVNTGISIGIRVVYGLFNRTPEEIKIPLLYISI